MTGFTKNYFGSFNIGLILEIYGFGECLIEELSKCTYLDTFRRYYQTKGDIENTKEKNLI